MKRPLRVLRVIHDMGTGGAERQCAEVLEELKAIETETDVQVDLVTLYGPPEKHRTPLAQGVHWQQLNRPCSIWGMFAAAMDLRRIVKGYDVVHGMLWPAIWALALSHGDVPVIASIHGSAVRTGWFGWKGPLDRLMFSQARQVIFNSHCGSSQLGPYYGANGERRHIVVNGKQVYDGPWPEREGVICPARVVPPKRQDLLLAALSLLPEGLRPKTSFAGRLTASRAFLKRITSSRLDNVVGLGEVSELMPLLAASQVVALPTEHEGMPNAILEGWNAGSAVLASKVSGVSELIRDEVDGLLVENTPEAWAAGLTRLLTDENLRDRLGREGRRRLQGEFSLARTSKHWVGAYEEAVGAGCMEKAPATVRH